MKIDLIKSDIFLEFNHPPKIPLHIIRERLLGKVCIFSGRKATYLWEFQSANGNKIRKDNKEIIQKYALSLGVSKLIPVSTEVHSHLSLSARSGEWKKHYDKWKPEQPDTYNISHMDYHWYHQIYLSIKANK